jgi:hypothetical protein
MAFAERELLRLLPRVLRARDFHLYTEGGKRLVDLWLQGGKAVLGHKPPKVTNELKNAAERGLFTPLPHPMEKRFIKALGEFFPGKTFRLYPDEGSLFRALAEAGFSAPFPDPAFPESGNTNISLWRPFLEPNNAPILIPVLPWPLSPAALALEEGSFPAGDLIPPVLLAPAARSLYSLAAEQKALSQNYRFPKIDKALKGSIWRRNGIYLTINRETEKEEYKKLFLNFLDGGFLIPPSPLEPLILPRIMSDGEEAKLASLLQIN